jgi:hypothetical protein
VNNGFMMRKRTVKDAEKWRQDKLLATTPLLRLLLNMLRMLGNAQKSKCESEKIYFDQTL